MTGLEVGPSASVTAPTAATEPSPAATTTGAPASGWESGYRPYLDGLRAVAVYLVVLFHAGNGWFDSGYVGVDVFFVLSGFLVTRLLLRDLNDHGRVGFRRFYARRFRRLLPAAFVTLIVTAIVFTALASPVAVLDAVGAFKAAFLYVTNWYFIDQSSGYFGIDVTASPVLQFWSLAVEEQFYLLWPLLLGALFAATRRLAPGRQSRWLRVAIGAGALASFALAWSLRTTSPNHAYFGTDTRAYQLLAGALLALSPEIIEWLRRRPGATRALAGVALVALIAIASSWTGLDPIERGIAVTAVTVALLAALEATSGAGPGRLLTLGPVVYLGKISYGTYLWHWPVVVVLALTLQLTTAVTVMVTLVAATALASLSFQLLEHPIRVSALLDRHRGVVIATGLAISITAAVVLIPAIAKPTTTAATGGDLSATGFTPVPTGIDWQELANEVPPVPNCYGKPADACTLVHGTGPHIMLIGDSNAGMLLPAFRALAETNNLTLSAATLGGCPWQRGLSLNRAELFGQTVLPEDCLRFKDDAYERVIPELDPDIVVSTTLGFERSGGFSVYIGPNGENLRPSSPELAPWVREKTEESLDELRADGRKVLIIESIPVDLSAPSLDCLSQAKVLAECRYVVPVEPTVIEKIYRDADRNDDRVWSLDLDKLVCPYLPICDPIVNHEVVKSDASHLSREFAATLEPALDEYLKQNAILPS